MYVLIVLHDLLVGLIIVFSFTFGSKQGSLHCVLVLLKSDSCMLYCQAICIFPATKIATLQFLVTAVVFS